MKAVGVPPVGLRALARGTCVASSLLCATATAEPVIDEDRVSPIIYGADDRQDFYAVDDPNFQDVASRSVVALISPLNLVESSRGVAPLAFPLGQLCLTNDCVPMCPEERFLDQPSAAECSGVLVDDDLVLTAGHCFVDADDCDRYRYVFDYYFEADGQLAPISNDDVYGCEQLVLWSVPPKGGPESDDYALVKLDRAVDAFREPVTLRDELPTEGDRVAALGFPIGLPLKIDRGGEVKDARSANRDYFTATTDTYAGNSGSGMFDGNAQLVGHLVTGGSDFDIDPVRNCLSSVVVPDTTRASLYEHGVYVDAWRSVLCESGYESARLCGPDAPIIKAPIITADTSGGSDGGASGVPKRDRGCSAARGPGHGFALTLLVTLGALLTRRRRRA